MSAHTLPDDPAYAFCPAGDSHDGPFQIRIAVEDMAVSIPTSLFAVSLKCCAQHFSDYVAVAGMLR